MRIAVDARELAGQPTGVGRFLERIASQWGTLPEAAVHEWILCAPSPIGPDPLGGLRYETASRSGRGTLWEQRTLPDLARRSGADVLFCPAYSGPLTGAPPMVVAIHDVSFTAHPEWYRWREGLRRRFLARHSARRARRVITISEFSRREIVERLGIEPSKIEVVYPGVTAIAAREAARESSEPLVLYVGSIFTRRHLPETIRGFARLARRRPDIQLAIVGDNRSVPRLDLDALIADAGQTDRARAWAYVPDTTLADLYRRARAFVFLSEYEGFGLTPLEALASGIPIVVLDTPVAREVCGAAAIYVASPDPRLVEPALERALFDDDARASVLGAAPAVLQRYSWRECARRVLAILESAA